MALRLRRGTDAERLLITPLQGEPIFTTDTKRLYVGDGSTVGGVLVTGDQSNTQVLADTTPQLGGDLDLNGNNITGAGNIAIDGTITATGSISLGDGDEDAIAVGGLINTNLRPAIDGAYDVGTSLRRWNNVWAEGANISGQLTTDSLSVETIISQDSTVLYESSTNTVTAEFVGNLTGNVSGNANGNHTGSFTGTITGDDGVRNVINKFDSNDVNITGGALNGSSGTLQIGTDEFSNVNIVGEEIKAKDGFFGTLFGSVDGNLQGDVFADDSTLVIDGKSGAIFSSNVTLNNGIFTSTQTPLANTKTQNQVVFGTADSPTSIVIDGGSTSGHLGILGVNAPGVTPTINLLTSDGTTDNPTDLQIGNDVGGILFNGWKDNAWRIGGGLRTEVQSVDNDYIGMQLKMSVVGTSGIVEAKVRPDNVMEFTGAIKPGVYADAAARDANLPSPEAGMMVFVTDVAKFTGYDGTAWVNLH